jgi:hypothetical protein
MPTNIGTGPQDIPLNQFLGEMAFMDRPTIRPRFHVNLSADQTSYDARNINTTRIEYDNVVYDIGSNFVTGGGNIGRFVSPSAGLYLFHASAISNGGTAYSQSWFQINGIRAQGSDWVRGGNTYANCAQNSTHLYCEVGDLVSFHPYNNTTGMTIDNSVHHTYFKGCLIG